MKYDKPITDLITTRFSCRTFERRALDEAPRNELVAACAEFRQGLAGEPARLQLIEPSETEFNHLRLGGGTIRGAGGLLAGAAADSPSAHVSLGYLLEHVVLKATDLGLATCWIGYYAPAAIEKLNLTGGEVCSAIVAVGHFPSGPSLRDRVVRMAVGATRRKHWEQLFFRDVPGELLSRGQAGDYSVALDMVRYAPSAGNAQPWRIGKARSLPVFNFYLKPVIPRYNRHHMHDVDMGIAICHFELGVQEMNLSGRWEIFDPASVPPVEGTRYVITWIGD